MDSDSDVDDVLVSNEDDNAIDERKHNKLLDAITSLDGNKRHKLTQRTVYSNQVSEYNFSTSKDGSSRVYLHELVGTLKDSGSHGTLKKQLNTVNKKKQLVSVPLPKHEKEKIERTTAYESTTVDLSKWDPVVKSNRHADQQQFPLQKTDVRLVSSAQFVNRFKPRTPLEMQVAALLHGSDHVGSKHEELTPAEQRALRAMDLEEARERRSELCRHRALLSYKEAKAKRQKKIKSKKYHRILKKEKLKTEGKELETMKTQDPEGYLEKMKELERARIQERLTLKHRGGTKFARRQMLYAKYNDKARDQVQEMLQMSREITQKTEVASEDDEEEEVAEEEDTSNPTTMVHFSYKGDNPWMAKPQAVQNSLPEAKEGGEGSDSEEEKPAVAELNEDVNKSGVKDDDDDDVLKQLTKVKVKKRKSKSDQGNTGLKLSDNTTQGNVNDIDGILDIKANKSEKKKKKKAKKMKEGKKTQKGEAGVGAEMVIDKLVESVTKNKKIIIGDDIDDDDDDDDEGFISEGLARKRTMEDMNELQNEDEYISPAKKSKKGNNCRQEKGDKSGKTGGQKVPEISVDPKKLFTLETRIEQSGNGPDIMEADDDDEDVIDADEQQRMTIAQAFADDDVIDEFTSEKKEMEDRDKPKDLDLFMPGWGSWGGTGVRPPKQKRKRFIIKAPPGPPRKDMGLGNVIISENKSEAVRKHQVSNIPFPYVNADQFEQSIRTPVGRTWNPETAFKDLIKPKVKTQIGAIIAPMDKEEVFKDQKNKKPDLSQNKTDKISNNKKNFKSGQNQKRQGHRGKGRKK